MCAGDAYLSAWMGEQSQRTGFAPGLASAGILCEEGTHILRAKGATTAKSVDIHAPETSTRWVTGTGAQGAHIERAAQPPNISRFQLRHTHMFPVSALSDPQHLPLRAVCGPSHGRLWPIREGALTMPRSGGGKCVTGIPTHEGTHAAAQVRTVGVRRGRMADCRQVRGARWLSRSPLELPDSVRRGRTRAARKRERENTLNYS